MALIELYGVFVEGSEKIMSCNVTLVTALLSLVDESVSVCDCEELQTLTCLPRAGNVHHRIGPA